MLNPATNSQANQGRLSVYEDSFNSTSSYGFQTQQGRSNAICLQDYRDTLDTFVASHQNDNSLNAMRDLARNFKSLELQARREAAQEGNVGLDCRNWGIDESQTNPKTGDDCWSGNAWDWARGALQSVDSEIPELDARNSLLAYQRLEKKGKLHFGSPPPGALIFQPKANGYYRLGFANPDGTTFRSTVPQSRNDRGIGDRPLGKDVAWMMPPTPPVKDKPGRHIDPKAIHMTQTYDRRYNPSGDPTSGDCVCTSLAMGLKALGKGVKGNPQQQIDKVRYAMTHGVRNDRDGYDSHGRRSRAEHALGTDPAECQRGAEKLGLNARGRAHSVADLKREVQAGHPVVLFGENGYNIWGKDHGLYPFNGKHGVLLSDYNPKTGMYTINDPLSHGGPIKLTEKQLNRFHFAGEDILGVVLKPKKD